jgi:hypothetical protein
MRSTAEVVAMLSILELVGEDVDSRFMVPQRVASVWRRHFHYEWCKWAQDIRERNLVWFSSRYEAIAVGKVPCKNCCA